MRAYVLDEVNKERQQQDAKWGEQNHTPGFWLMILGEEVGEANKAALEAAVFACRQDGCSVDGLSDAEVPWDKASLTAFREELIQVAAVAVAMVERIDRGSW